MPLLLLLRLLLLLPVGARTRAGVIRKGPAMDSEKVGNLVQGEEILVIGQLLLEDGTVRFHIY